MLNIHKNRAKNMANISYCSFLRNVLKNMGRRCLAVGVFNPPPHRLRWVPCVSDVLSKSGFAKYLPKSMIIVSPRPLPPATGHLLPAHVSQNGALFFHCPCFFWASQICLRNTWLLKRPQESSQAALRRVLGDFWLILAPFGLLFGCPGAS